MSYAAFQNEEAEAVACENFISQIDANVTALNMKKPLTAVVWNSGFFSLSFPSQRKQYKLWHLVVLHERPI